ncbi:MAG: epimerase [Phycisphaerae bacterium]|nr:epimerase [Phycisphaerae bacterium]
MASGTTAIVTGGAGFIGSAVSVALAARGHRVVAVDSLDTFYDPALKRANIEHTLANVPDGAFELVEADIRDAAAMESLYEARRPALTVHLAARAGVRPSIAQPALYSSVNVEGTTVLLEAARKHAAAAPFLMASSSSVYGNNEKTPFAEDDPVERPISPYAATKRSCELIAATYHELYALPVACLRFFTVYGPRQRPDLAIAKFMRLMRDGEAIPVFGDGSMSRDFTYIDDIVAGVLAAGDHIGEHGYRIWNLGSDHPVRLDEMIAAIAGVLGVEPKIDRQPAPPGDVRRTWCDLTRSRAELGYDPATPFEEGLRRQSEA